MTLSQKWARVGRRWENLFQFIGNTFHEVNCLHNKRDSHLVKVFHKKPLVADGLASLLILGGTLPLAPEDLPTDMQLFGAVLVGCDRSHDCDHTEVKQGTQS